MNTRIQLITVALNILGQKGVIAPVDGVNEVISSVLTGKSVNQRRAEMIDATLVEAVAKAKKISTNRKFKKIIEHV